MRRVLLKLHVRALRLKLFAEREMLSAEQFDCRDRLVPWRFSSENSMSGSRPDTEGIDVVSAVSRQGHVAAMVFRPRMVHLSSPMNLARNSCRDGIDSWWIRSKFKDWPRVKWISNFLNSLIAEIDLFLGDSAPRTPCLEADLTRKG